MYNMSFISFYHNWIYYREFQMIFLAGVLTGAILFTLFLIIFISKKE
jgi:hypothetical protein